MFDQISEFSFYILDVYTIFEKRLPQREEATEQRIVRDPAGERRRDNFTERRQKTSAGVVFPTRLLTSEDEYKWYWHQMI
jgi:hypothetical protein